MSTALFLSPHLDDAVFSCAGMMQRALAAGERVLVATVFTEGSIGYNVRRREDEAAVGWLGAEVVHLGLTDAPDRNPAYRSFREIVFGWQPEDERTLDSVVELLRGLCRRENPSRVFAPLGVGTHVDHRLVHEAVRRVDWPGEVWFYEDRPYAYAHGAAELRLRQLGYDGGAVLVPELLKTFRLLPHVCRYLPAGAERRHCEALFTAPLNADTGICRKSGAELLVCTVGETSVAHQAAALYATQFPSFCGDRRRLMRMDRSHSMHLGCAAGRTERYRSLH